MKSENQIYGLHAIIEAINTDRPINKVYLQKRLQGDLFKKLETLIRKKGVVSSYVPIEKLNKLTKNNHQGAVALISPIAFSPFEEVAEHILKTKDLPFFLLLDRLSDVRNFGAIIRTAVCCGVDAIVVPKTGSAPINDDTVKTSAGAAFNIPIAKVDHLKDAVFYLQSSGIEIIAATEKTENSIYDVSFNKPCAVIMGSEGKGISPSLLKLADHSAKLPMLGDIESLNVSVACGVFLYEVVRQRMD
ncbi:23S rRNA (guanosine(2251)-2'-O)-methyltransferase RlmB [Allomuricauda sp. SCSIO 65647]|uniref:23S rRNA (guanosine(2251)-2'-O)-methyltransferase RlmB n=1 Tax=Allomuricauda sp. SCSIO 65647 TaxID=2908843 RepID=UPI001F31FEB5|nr:23S rRNA (guanosine(2251)-2'-O)-methyltransferase RlmB [Muricauda sp. SCSIO 65647]UJH66549.1 23S rRNA (guanosine(2251)-2'-O)-methyltransferase RlmB [Muricauda sp. SCSIO 65647]